MTQQPERFSYPDDPAPQPQYGDYPIQPGQYPQEFAYPVAAAVPYPVAAEKPKSRRPLAVMLAICVVLALAFGGTAYYFFFAGASATETVELYIQRAQAEDFAGARDLTSPAATQGVRLQGNSEGMETMRRWFGEDSMEWKVRREDTSGSKSTVTVDKALTLPNYDETVDMRWDYRLERQSGSWMITSAKIMTIVGQGLAEPGQCLRSDGFQYSSADCAATADGTTIIYEVIDSVDAPFDCPDPRSPMVETTGREILCLEETSGS